MIIGYAGNDAYKLKKINNAYNALKEAYGVALLEIEALRAILEAAKPKPKREKKEKAAKPAPKPKRKPLYIKGKPRRKTPKELEELRAAGLAPPAIPRKKKTEEL